MIPPELDRALRDAEELEVITTGRRSRATHAVKVWFAYDSGEVWLRTDRGADWLRNLDSDPRCRIRVGGIEASARREPVFRTRTVRHSGEWRQCAISAGWLAVTLKR